MSRPTIEWVISGLFGLTALAGVALLAVYILGGQTQVEGVLLAIALGALGVGIVLWTRHLMVTPAVIEERHPATSTAAETADFQAALMEEAGFSRRKLLVGMLATAFAGLGAALAIPVLSLGPAPGAEVFATSWRPGKRVVGEDGMPIRATDLELDSLVTVFPDGPDRSPGDSQTILIKLPAGVNQPRPGREDWVQSGCIAYSKICTHAGCPVGLYRSTDRRLICPCHQSTFEVTAGAVPVFGPAGRPLPQLPIRLEADGTFTAIDDFPEAVGPSIWNIHQGDRG